MDIKKILLSVVTVTGMLTAGTVAANADTVTVKAGDTVSELANEYNTTIDTITQENSLQDANVIVVGQKLEVGETANTNSTATTTSTASVNASSTATSTAAASTSNTTTSTAAASTSSAATSTTATSTSTSTPAASSSSTTTAASSSVASSTTSSTSSTEAAARAWIAARESGGSYTVQNGQYYGKYQLSISYLNGDYSAANQERVANSYVISRYGSWVNAVKHWETSGWY
ncbi:LysM domain-containing protein [Lactobacillus sp. UCMA15818]|uniref:aggregation-promoting factor n=1 Tax=Lactobacillaceae TaxID=33958 RepID=UPI0025B1DB89|nr:LysM domain-containing protein [Lactobacillus sp. UCMA15818]MDN2454397.1 LysM peptidoglycan-binding domain-containing protein [Lactobacillus sp. UCMA15818]